MNREFSRYNRPPYAFDLIHNVYFRLHNPARWIAAMLTSKGEIQRLFYKNNVCEFRIN